MSRQLTMQRLAIDVIERRDREAAIVLGDAMMERGLDRIFTGRVRRAMFRAEDGDLLRSDADTKILSAHEIDVIRGVVDRRFYVPAREVLYNVGGFARSPSANTWDKIWTQWVTPWHATYQAMVRSRILPRSLRVAEIEPQMIHSCEPDILIGLKLWAVRIPRRRKQPVRAPLFKIYRLDVDNPRTRHIHFDQDAAQQTLFDRDKRRRR